MLAMSRKQDFSIQSAVLCNFRARRAVSVVLPCDKWCGEFWCQCMMCSYRTRALSAAVASRSCFLENLL